MSELPSSWSECAIGDACKVIGGGTPPSSDPANFTAEDGIPWITPADLSGYKEKYIGRGKRNLTASGLTNSAAKVMPAGTVLFSSRAPVGYVAIAANEVATNQGFKSFLIPDGFDSSYIYYYLRHIKPEAEARATGTTFKELSGSAAAKLPLIVPPSSEQRRIGEKLDAIMGSIDICRERLDRVPWILKRFREAVLDAAVSGRLTLSEDRQSDRISPFRAPWDQRPFADLIESIRTGTIAVPQATPTKYPVLRSSSVRPMALDLHDARFLSREQSANKDNYLKTGDLLFTRLSGSKEFVGNCAIVRELSGLRIQYPDRLFRARLREPRQARFVEIAFASAVVRRQIELSLKSSAGHQRISTDAITRAVVPIPPIHEQEAIVRRVDELFALADRFDRRYKAAVARMDKLPSAVLSKAFCGRLVLQDPNDEPAEGLLERIKGLTETQMAVKNKRVPKGVTIGATTFAGQGLGASVQGQHSLVPLLRKGVRMQPEALLQQSGLNIDEFYDRLKADVEAGRIREVRSGKGTEKRYLELVP